MSDRAKVAAGILAVAAAVVLFVVLQQSDDDSEPAGRANPPSKKADNGLRPPHILVIRLRGGEPVLGTQKIVATSGDRVRFRVVADTDGEVHVHGYDDEKPVAAGGAVSFDFPATLEGGYEIELHGADGAHSVIGELKVQPG